jgi:hypothetical protein
VALLLCLTKICFSQTSADATIQINAQINTNNNSIELSWPFNNFSTQYLLYRKTIADANWGNVIAVLSQYQNTYVDFDVSQGEYYEYKVSTTGSISASGYILVGNVVNYTEYRGKLILLVDDSFTESLTSEIKTLIADLEGDGYEVIKYDVARDETVANVKQIIVNEYNTDPNNVKSIFLLGHIPVPYSGFIVPDGHPEHKGAWPADVYYADMDGVWTDNIVNSTTAADARNRNIPGDGKFDQSVLPSEVELEIGRVDFSDMPAFIATETELLRNYLIKNHAYKIKAYSPEKRALIEDNFGYFSGEAFAAGAWRSFSPLVGNGNIIEGDFTGELSSGNYLWAYGCGSGSYNAAAGIGTTEQFAGSELNVTFSMLFGSYFGDWDNSNNFMRSILAQGKTLSCAWSGRPYWAFHPMAIGKSLGHCTKLTQNNLSTYDFGYGSQFVHIALMGDPSLRNDVVAPITDLTAALNSNVCVLNWTASSDTVRGYNIYKKALPNGTFERLNSSLITATTYIDSCVLSTGQFAYMVRGVKLIETPAGSYYNSSIGISDTINQELEFSIVANATIEYNGNSIQFINESINATNFQWTFSNQSESEDVSPIIAFDESTFSATLIASNSCMADTFFIEGEFPVGIHQSKSQQIIVYPNPTKNEFSVVSINPSDNLLKIDMIDVMGKQVKSIQVSNNKTDVLIGDLETGVYLLRFSFSNKTSYSKLMVN